MKHRESLPLTGSVERLLTRSGSTPRLCTKAAGFPVMSRPRLAALETETTRNGDMSLCRKTAKRGYCPLSMQTSGKFWSQIWCGGRGAVPKATPDSCPNIRHNETRYEGLENWKVTVEGEVSPLIRQQRLVFMPMIFRTTNTSSPSTEHLPGPGEEFPAVTTSQMCIEQHLELVYSLPSTYVHLCTLDNWISHQWWLIQLSKVQNKNKLKENIWFGINL